MIFNVLIAEDEPLVSEFIADIVKSYDGLSVQSVCCSGEEACETIKNKHPHILITDIRMHGMNGLELISRVKKEIPDIQVIIVSGYSLFEYAKEAIRLGVEDYLLKPIDIEELKRSLDNIYASLLGRCIEKKNQTLRKLLIHESFDRIPCLFDGKDLQIMMVNQSGDPESTLELCMNGATETCITEASIALWNRSVLITGPYDSCSDFKNLRQWLRCHTETKTLLILYSQQGIKKEDMQKMLPDFHRKSREERILGMTVEHTFKSVSENKVNTEGLQPDKACNIISRDGTLMHDVYISLFNKWNSSHITVRSLRSSIFSILRQINRVYPFFEGLQSAEERIAECIKYSDSFDEACDSTWNIIEDITQNQICSRNDSTSSSLESLYSRISSFLQTNCEQNYSLVDIADMFHVSQPYISKAFRTYADMTYKEFCINQKINLAEKLISSKPNLLLKDVATQVGIAPAYFGTVFHRVTGEYPSEFKTKLSENK